MKLLQTLLLTLALAASSAAQAGKISIAAAADLKFAMSEIVTAFKQANPGEEVEVIYGSSGKFYTGSSNNPRFSMNSATERCP